jgi:hypothetical protein
VIRHADHVAPSIRKKLAITSPTSGGRSVRKVRSRTQAMEFILVSIRSLHVSARVGHLQVNIFFEARYCLLTDPLFGLSLHMLSLIINR